MSIHDDMHDVAVIGADSCTKVLYSVTKSCTEQLSPVSGGGAEISRNKKSNLYRETGFEPVTMKPEVLLCHWPLDGGDYGMSRSILLPGFIASIFAR
jgi:hypothetical protein